MNTPHENPESEALPEFGSERRQLNGVGRRGGHLDEARRCSPLTALLADSGVPEGHSAV